MKVLPLHDRVLVRLLDDEQKSSGGIILAKEQSKKSLHGLVIAVGQGYRNRETNQITPLGVKEGDVVIFNKYASTEVTLNHLDDSVIVREDDILAIISDN